MKDEVEKLIAILTEYDQMKIPVFTENITADKAITNSKKIDLAREYAAARILKLRETAQVEAVRAARIAENRMYLDRINNWKPKPGELTAASFGSAGAALTESAWKHAFEDRLARLGEK